MKIKLILSTIICFFITFSAQAQDENVKYQEINGKHYKFYYYENDVIKAKESVLKVEDGTYSSLDFYEFYNKDGNLVFKGNKIRGRHIEYYPSGEKKIHGSVMNGEKQGRWSYYLKNKTIIKVEVYQAGELVETIKN